MSRENGYTRTQKQDEDRRRANGNFQRHVLRVSDTENRDLTMDLAATETPRVTASEDHSLYKEILEKARTSEVSSSRSNRSARPNTSFKTTIHQFVYSKQTAEITVNHRGTPPSRPRPYRYCTSYPVPPYRMGYFHDYIP